MFGVGGGVTLFGTAVYKHGATKNRPPRCQRVNPGIPTFTQNAERPRRKNQGRNFMSKVELYFVSRKKTNALLGLRRFLEFGKCLSYLRVVPTVSGGFGIGLRPFVVSWVL